MNRPSIAYYTVCREHKSPDGSTLFQSHVSPIFRSGEACEEFMLTHGVEGDIYEQTIYLRSESERAEMEAKLFPQDQGGQ